MSAQIKKPKAKLQPDRVFTKRPPGRGSNVEPYATLPHDDEIKRMAAPPKDVFWREFLLRQRPVILTDLFAGQLISRITTYEEMQRRLGSVKIQIREA